MTIKIIHGLKANYMVRDISNKNCCCVDLIMHKVFYNKVCVCVCVWVQTHEHWSESLCTWYVIQNWGSTMTQAIWGKLNYKAHTLYHSTLNNHNQQNEKRRLTPESGLPSPIPWEMPPTAMLWDEIRGNFVDCSQNSNDYCHSCPLDLHRTDCCYQAEVKKISKPVPNTIDTSRILCKEL